IRAANPAFDVTPHRYVTAIITENGVVHPPFGEGLQRVVGAGGVGARHASPLPGKADP
ncbi:MAG: hypothetical protein M1531_00460, partial [Chloroflexi bacterium]|nr:hypothetical protein [Chloroflexota bacterium]